MSNVVHTTATREELREYLRQLPGVLTGRLPDYDGIAHGFKLRMAFAFFYMAKEAFIVKSRGGTDDTGTSWPKQTAKYLAYGRGPKSTRRGGGVSPGGKDGFMTKDQLKRWQRTYAQTLARLLLQVPEDEAKRRAAQIAWAQAKREGVQTLLQVFGSRWADILRDTGLLFNSMSPGVLVENGPDASYGKPPDQIVEERPGELAVGTNVKYAAKHHYGKRPLWPKDGNLPGSWWEEILDGARSGLLMLRGPQN